MSWLKPRSTKMIEPLGGPAAAKHSGKRSRRDAGATNILGARARWMGGASPSICAGRSMLRPYEETATQKWMGRIAPSICAGRSMLRPYEETATQKWMGGIAPSICAPTKPLLDHDRRRRAITDSGASLVVAKPGAADFGAWARGACSF